jgi:hypothetical protein
LGLGLGLNFNPTTNQPLSITQLLSHSQSHYHSNSITTPTSTYPYTSTHVHARTRTRTLTLKIRASVFSLVMFMINSRANSLFLSIYIKNLAEKHINNPQAIWQKRGFSKWLLLKINQPFFGTFVKRAECCLGTV